MRSEIATAADARAVAELLDSADWSLPRRGGIEAAEPLPGMTSEEAAAMIGRASTIILVRRAGTFPMLLGCIAVEMNDMGACTISMLAVASEFRRTAIGRALLEDAEQFAADRSATQARIVVSKSRRDLVAWYERRGYRPTGRREAHTAGLGGGDAGLPSALRFIVLEKRL
ncbi:GNAT family N-acetyltransferase [Roseomonas hellenica]|uniref:GNAT family N-acetyltransferase n=1 Tax=Plastoroseomonas hellenica TaxID=2687306 RepID=A0ABS5ES32_9PROT|nr:GNAT family N-acetyltransferase [Plastoroseomonas hellenica]MBR0663100.1 GNAT family N-acetyltransferase [Plastoroseomonas hellenica]